MSKKKNKKGIDEDENNDVEEQNGGGDGGHSQETISASSHVLNMEKGHTNWQTCKLPLSFLIASDDELGDLANGKVRMETTVVGFICLEFVLICVDGCIVGGDSRTNLNDDWSKLFWVTGSVFGAVYGVVDHARTVIRNVKEHLENVPPQSIEEIAGCFATWANVLGGDCTFILGGHLNVVDDMRLYKISKQEGDYARIEEAIRHSSIAVKVYRGRASGPYVAYEQSVTAIGKGNREAVAFLGQNVTYAESRNEERMRMFAKAAVNESVLLGNNNTGRKLNMITIYPHSGQQLFHSASLEEPSCQRYGPLVENGFLP